MDDRSHRAHFAEYRRGQRLDRFVDAVSPSAKNAAGGRVEWDRLRQVHPTDFHHRQEVAQAVSDLCRGDSVGAGLSPARRQAGLKTRLYKSCAGESEDSPLRQGCLTLMMLESTTR